MSSFEKFITNKLDSLDNETSFNDEDLFSRLKDLYREEQREVFGNNLEADLKSADDLSPYTEVKTLSELNALVSEDQPNAFAPPELQPAPSPKAPEEAVVPTPVQTEPLLEGDTDGAFVFAIDQFQKTIGEGVQTIGDATGFDGLSKLGKSIVDQQAIDIQAGGYKSTYTKPFLETAEGGFFDAIGWVGEAIAENWASTGASFIGGGAGLLVKGGTKVGLKILGKELSRRELAAGVATGTVTSTLGIGEVRSELEAKGVYDKDDAAFAVGAGVVIGLLDKVAGKAAVTPANIGAFADSGIIKEVGLQALKSSAIKTGKSAGFESLTEAGQELVVIGSGVFQGAEFNGTETFNRVIDSMVVGGAMGAGVSASSEITSKLVKAGIPDTNAPAEGQQATEVPAATVEEEVQPSDDAVTDEEVQPAEEQAEVTEDAVEDVVSTELDDSGLADIEADINEGTTDEVVDESTVRSAVGVKDKLAAIAADTIGLRTDPVETNFDALNAYLDGNPAAVQESTQSKRASLLSRKEDFAGVESYDQMESLSSAAAKRGIEELVEKSGITLTSIGQSDNAQSLYSQVARGEVGYEPSQVTPDGLLSGLLPNTNVSYLDALFAVENLYGRVSVGGRHGQADNVLARKLTSLLFDPQARAIIDPVLASRNDITAIPPRHELITERQALSQSAPELAEGLEVEQEARDASEPTKFEVADAAGKLGVQEPIGVITARAIEKVLNFGSTTGQTPTAIGTQVRRVVKNYILNAQDAALSEQIRDVQGLRANTKRLMQGLVKEHKQAVKGYVANYKGDKKKLEQSFKDLEIDLLQGDLQPVLKDAAKPVSPDNIIVENGNVLLHSKDTLIRRRVPVDVLVPYMRFAEQNHADGLDLIKLYQSEVAAAQQVAEQKKSELDDLTSELIAATADLNGTNSVEYLALKDTKVGNKWRAILSTEKGSSLGNMVDFAIEKIAFDQGLNDAGYIAEIDRLTDLFLNGVENSNSIEKFAEETQGAFGDAANIEPSIAASLGPITGDGAIQNIVQRTGVLNNELENIARSVGFVQNLIDNGYYSATIYRAHTDPEGTFINGMASPQTKEEKKARKDYTQFLADEIVKNSSKSNPISEENALVRAEEQVNSEVIALRDGGDVGISLSGGIDITGNSNSASLKQEDKSKAYNAFYGRETEPDNIMVATILRRQELQWNKELIKFFRDSYVGNGAWASVEEAAEAGVTADRLMKIEMPRTDNPFKKDVLFATEEIATSLEQFKSRKPDDRAAVNILLQFGANYRTLTTVQSIPLAASNVIAGASTSFMGGGVRLLQGKKSIANRVMSELIGSISVGKAITDPDVIEAIAVMDGSGAKQKQLENDLAISGGGILDQTLKLAGSVAPGSQSRAATNVARRGLDKFFNVGVDFYRFGDLMPKVAAYIAIKEDITAQHSHWMTEAEISGEAKTQARDLGYDMAQVPQVVKFMQDRALLGGAFLSFQSLFFATITKNLRNLKRLHNMDVNSYGYKNLSNFNPETDFNQAEVAMKAAHPIGRYAQKRAGYMAGAMAWPVMLNAAIGTGVASVFGAFGDDEEDQLGGFSGAVLGLGKAGETRAAMRTLMPDYYRDSTFTLVDADEKGKIKWLDTARISNHGLLFETFNSLFNAPEGASAGKSISDAIGKLFSGYFTPGFGVQAAAAVISNNTEFGQEVYNEEENIIQNAGDIATFLAGTLTRNVTAVKATGGLYDLVKGNDFNQFSGIDNSLGSAFLDGAGIRVKTFDPSKELFSRLGNENGKTSGATTLARSELKSFNSLSDSKIRSIVARTSAVHNSSMVRVLSMIDAARQLGVSEEDIDASLKLKRFNIDKRKSLLAGIAPPYVIGKIGSQSTQSAKLRAIDERATDQFDSNFKRAIDIANNL